MNIQHFANGEFATVLIFFIIIGATKAKRRLYNFASAQGTDNILDFLGFYIFKVKFNGMFIVFICIKNKAGVKFLAIFAFESTYC